ncbi:MAG: relaxase/mobilization nuclease domain-containing protein [Bacteroidales bacterium]|nr:relaxase/mobilization nuclease domain-containing protein [Candidatus Scybalocola fimicaballi]
MIIKVIKGSDLKAAIRYNTQKVKNECASVLSAHNLPIDDLNNLSLLERMMKNIATPLKGFKTKVEKYVFHGVISPEEKDLSDATLKQLSDDYMKELGYEKQPYFVVKHQDTDHIHVHIVSVDIDKKGKKCIDDSFQYRKTSEIRKNLELKYHLSSPNKSINYKEQVKQNVSNAIHFVDKTSFHQNDVSNSDYKNNIQRVLRKVRNEYEFTNFDELNRILASFGIKSEVNNLYKGVSFYSVDENGKQKGKAIAGSKFLYSYSTWQEQFERNEVLLERRKNQINVSKKHVRWATDQILKKYAGKITYGDYIAQVKTHGIDAQPIVNDYGLLIGFNFVDHARGYQYKASEVDRELSKELKSRLIAGGVGESPEIRETNRLQKALEEMLQRRVKEHFDFESNAIRFLRYETDLYISYCQEFYHANEYNTRFAIEKFLEDKNKQLDAIYEKEEMQFNEDVAQFKKIASVVDPNKLEDLLRASKFNFEEDRLYDSRRPDFHVENTGIPFPEFSNFRRHDDDKKLTQREIDFYTLVADKGIENIKFNFFNLNDKLFRFLSDEDKTKVHAKMMQDKIASLMDSYPDSEAINRIVMSGMLFDFKGDDIVISSPNSSAKLVVTDKKMRESLLSRKDSLLAMNDIYRTKNGYATLLYQAMQKFYRVMESDFKQKERYINICDWMAQHNPTLATDIRRMVEQEQYANILRHLTKYAETDLSFLNYTKYCEDKAVGFYYNNRPKPQVKNDSQTQTSVGHKSKETTSSTTKDNSKKKKGFGI